MQRRQWHELGRALRELRSALDLGQKEVISRSGEDIAERTLRAYESGEQRPGRDRLIRLLTKSFELRSGAEIARKLQTAGYSDLADHEMVQLGLDPNVQAGRQNETSAHAQAKALAAPDVTALSLTAKAQMVKIRDEWENPGVAGLRRLFWETLDTCFAMHCLGQPGYPETLEELVDSARAPLGLPLPDGQHLREYAARCLETLADSDLLLHQFCTLVYPPKNPARTLKDCSRIDWQAFDEFHMHARWNFTRLWNRVGEAIYVEQSVDLTTVMRELHGSLRMIQMLSYLEISLVRWTRDSGMGMRWLFQLNRDWDAVLASRPAGNWK